jgi:protein-tyrosine sulfotransferase
MAGDPVPIFVLCYARSGSTLLRYVLDTHAEVSAPPELHLLLAGRQLVWLFAHTAGAPNTQLDERSRDAYAVEKAREVLTTVMTDYARRCGKRIWAEKSVSSVDCLDVLDKLYPRARLLCLHRHPLDTIASCMEAAQSRQGLFGFEPYAARTPGEPLNGLADYWIDKSRRLLQCERERPERCFRIRYEQLVTDTAATLPALFAFLGLEWDEKMVERIFSTPHAPGPGDSKILSAARIESRSVGRGQLLQVDAISPQRRKRLAELMMDIGYDRPTLAV